MISKKAAIFIAFAVFLGFRFNNLKVPDNVEKPYLLKAIKSMSLVVKFISKISADLNYGTEHGNFRNLLHKFSIIAVEKPDGLKIEDSRINDIGVRVYSPLNSDGKKLPLMIYYHGGAYVFGELKTYDLFLAELVKKLNMKIISVNYKLAPEYPFPTPVNDCYSITKHIMQNADKYDADVNSVILAGDSAGGNAVAVITQRLQAEKLKQPKIQVLIYPWMQFFNLRLPSHVNYASYGLLDGYTLTKYLSWYLGIVENSDEVEAILESNYHVDLIRDEGLKEKLKTFTDVDIIPDKYKSGKSFYDDYETQKKYIFPKLDENNSLRKDTKLIEKLSQLFTTDLSPGLAELSQLKGLPKSYFIICEWDSLKDEGLIYAERLKMAGVKVDTAYYEDSFHAAISFVGPNTGLKRSKQMINDLVNYLKENI